MLCKREEFKGEFKGEEGLTQSSRHCRGMRKCGVDISNLHTSLSRQLLVCNYYLLNAKVDARINICFTNRA